MVLVCVHGITLPVFVCYLSVSTLVHGASVPSHSIKVNNENLGAVPFSFLEAYFHPSPLPPFCQQICLDFYLKCDVFGVPN